MKACLWFLLVCLSLQVYASPSQIAALLYSEADDVELVTKFFEVVELHTKRDPLLGSRGPSIRDFSMNKLKFAFMVDETESTVDLVLFNWNISKVEGFVQELTLSKIYGTPVYRLANIDKKTLATQGENNDVLTNFSYLMGSRQMEYQVRRDNPDGPLPDWMENFPHPQYMKRGHPLRQALDLETLVMLSPKRELFFDLLTSSPEVVAMMEEQFRQTGGFIHVVLGMMIHEAYHCKDGDDNLLNYASPRSIEPDRDLLKEELEKSSQLRLLLATYKNIIFSIGRDFSQTQHLSHLSQVIKELKQISPEAWKYVWNYEFAEGFAEYVSAYSMVHVGVTTLEEQIGYQINDGSNNFAYRTGAIGGLYLSEKLHKMPFANEEDHRMSLWENILHIEGVVASSESLDQLMAKYNAREDDEEIARVIEYLVSTVVEMEE
jgi:hypothetical protein